MKLTGTVILCHCNFILKSFPVCNGHPDTFVLTTACPSGHCVYLINSVSPISLKVFQQGLSVACFQLAPPPAVSFGCNPTSLTAPIHAVSFPCLKSFLAAID
jgi:hypothetical protein